MVVRQCWRWGGEACRVMAAVVAHQVHKGVIGAWRHSSLASVYSLAFSLKVRFYWAAACHMTCFERSLCSWISNANGIYFPLTLSSSPPPSLMSLVNRRFCHIYTESVHSVFPVEYHTLAYAGTIFELGMRFRLMKPFVSCWKFFIISLKVRNWRPVRSYYLARIQLQAENWKKIVLYRTWTCWSATAAILQYWKQCRTRHLRQVQLLWNHLQFFHEVLCGTFLHFSSSPCNLQLFHLSGFILDRYSFYHFVLSGGCLCVCILVLLIALHCWLYWYFLEISFLFEFKRDHLPTFRLLWYCSVVGANTLCIWMVQNLITSIRFNILVFIMLALKWIS